MKPKFLLMRHAQGKHNRQKKQLQQLNPNFKQTKEFKKIKFSQQHIDPKDIYIPQQLNFQEFLSQENSFDIIVTSPLKRCLQTAKYIKQKLQENNRDAQIIVQPFLASRLCSAWNLGTALSQLLKEYSEDHFHFCNFPQDQHWGLNFMQLSKPQLAPKKTEFLMQDIQDLKVVLSRIVNGEKESHWNLNQRLEIAKQRLRFYATLTEKSLLVVSHSCHMSALCAKEFDDKGKPMKKLKFKHWEVVPADERFQIPEDKRREIEIIKPQIKKKQVQLPRPKL